MTTKSIGSSSRDYATLSAWASYVNALSLSAPEVGEMYNDSEFTESSMVTIGGWTGGSSTNTVTLTTAAGQSFRDTPSVQANALRYNQSNGVGLKMTGSYTASSVNVTGSHFVLSNIQFTSTQSNAQAIIFLNSANEGVLIENLIVQGATWRNDVKLVQLYAKTSSIIQNVAVILTSASGSGVGLLAAGSGATSAYDITVVGSNSAGGTGLSCTYTPAPLVTNCAVYGFATDYSGTASTSSTNNATDQSSFGGTNFGTSGQTSITSSEWHSVTLGSEDLRLALTSTKLKDNGATAGPSYDIAGTTRPKGSAYDIGCWELIQFNAGWAQSQDPIGDDAMYLKNTAGQYLGFALVNATNGAALTGATVTAYISIDGASQTTVTGTVSELGNGQYQLAMSQADTNGNDITFLFAATNAVPMEKTITTESSTVGSIATPPVERLAQGTYSIPVPINCIAWECYLIGGGGSGASAVNSSGGGAKASGGAGGSYAHGIRKLNSGASTLTLVIGAGGASVNRSSTGASAGNAGTASTCSDGAVTFTAPGGGGGVGVSANGTCAGATPGATGSVDDGGSVDAAQGGASGSCTSGTAATYNASGGGSPGGPWGNGQVSGAASGGTSTTQNASGGASPTFSSGAVTGIESASGGAGLGGASSAPGNVDGTGGGGGLGAGNGDTAGIGIFGTLSKVAIGIVPLIEQNAFGPGGAGVASATTKNDGGDGGGGGGAGSGTTAVNGGDGGFKGGGGGAATDAGGSTIAGNGGLFAGGGAAGAISVCIAGASAGCGGGGGGAVNINAHSTSSGYGGNGYGCVIFYVSPP